MPTTHETVSVDDDGVIVLQMVSNRWHHRVIAGRAVVVLDGDRGTGQVGGRLHLDHLVLTLVKLCLHLVLVLPVDHVHVLQLIRQQLAAVANVDGRVYRATVMSGKWLSYKRLPWMDMP